MSAEAETWWAESIFGAMTGKPLVQLTIGGGKHMISPEEARTFAYSIIEAAEAADMDAIVVTFLMNRLSIPREQAVLVLRDFRQIRDQERLKKQQ